LSSAFLWQLNFDATLLGLLSSASPVAPLDSHSPGVGRETALSTSSNLVNIAAVAGRPRVVPSVALAVALLKALFNFTIVPRGHRCMLLLWPVSVYLGMHWFDAGIHRLKPLLWTLGPQSPYFLTLNVFRPSWSSSSARCHHFADAPAFALMAASRVMTPGS